MGELVVKELKPSLRDDFLLFFDSVAFADNPDWSDCYCSLYHFANKGKAESRLQASSLIADDGTRPRQGRASRLNRLLRCSFLSSQPRSLLPPTERCMQEVFPKGIGVR